MANVLQIGQFEILDRIARGGMGEVWRGRHVAQGIPVAVKVMTVERARRDDSAAAFRNEVNAMARLNHPGIVKIFDSGRIPRMVEEASFGTLLEGSPLVTMELATHGTLEALRASLNWNRLRTIIFGVLDALSHAHARGVIHRDLKPSNILVTLVDSHPQVKLADFGLAHATSNQTVGRKTKTSGTPRYMAPEQVAGRIRDQGPWTDLYALGCVIYYLVNGKPPFSGAVEDILAAHLYSQLPRLKPTFELPDGFEDWLERLMAKDRSQRFTRAADAAFELFRAEPFSAGLEESISDIWEDIPNPPISNSALEVDAPTIMEMKSPHFSSLSLDTFHRTIPDVPIFEMDPTETEPPVLLKSQTPIPVDWRRPILERPSPRLIGAGLALYGLRPIPFIGRLEERDKLWKSLREVRREQTLRFVEIRGPMGAGKSRLAQWFAERAHEVGGAQPIVVTHNETMGPGDGVIPALRHALVCDNLDSESIFQRVRELYFRTGGLSQRDAQDCVGLTELFTSGDEHSQPTIKFGSPQERYALFRRVLRRLSHERPVLLLLDDAQWGVEAVEFVEYLGERPTFPLMIAATVRDEASRRGIEGRVRVRKLLEQDWADSIVLRVLDETDHRRLVADLLPLDKELESAIVERTAGNPLFAVQLIGDWVQRDILEVSDTGFVLKDGESISLPDSMHDVWVDRLEALEKSMPGIEASLRVAAALGLEVDEIELQKTVERLNIDLPNELVVSLVEQRLAEIRPNGWAFTHAMLRESLLRKNLEENDSTVHLAIAEMLSETNTEDVQQQLRTADHFVSADVLEHAIPIYINVAEQLERTSAFVECIRVLDKHDQTLSDLETPFEDPLWAKALHLRGTCLLRQGDVVAARELIDYAREMSVHEGWDESLGEFLLLDANLARKVGNSDVALEKYHEAKDVFVDDQVGRARALYGVGEMHLYQGHVSEALVQFESSIELSKDLDPERTAIATIGMASANIRLENYDLAREHLDRAETIFSDSGNRNGRAAAFNMVGELERARENWDEAVIAYEKSLEILESIGSWTTSVPRLNLALIHLAQERYVESRALFIVGLHELERVGEKAHIGFANVALCVAYAGLSDWPEYTKQLESAKRALDSSRWKDIEIAQHAEWAANLCRESGQKGLAAETYELAEAQYRSLRMIDDADRVRGEISRLFL